MTHSKRRKASKRKIAGVSALTALAAMSALTPVFVMEASAEVQHGDFTYKDNGDGTATITGYALTQAHVDIPSELNGLTVTAIGKEAFRVDFAKVRINSITIPETVTTIGQGAFGFQDIKNLTIPGTVETIESGAFRSINVETLTLEEGIKTIGADAFGNHKLSELTIPSTIEHMGSRVFGAYLSPALTIKISEGVTEISNSAFAGISKLKSVEIPDTVTRIGKSAFSESTNLESVRMSKNLQTLESRVFYGTHIKTVELPEGLEYIGESAFEYSGVEELELPSTLKEIGKNAFKDINLTKITIPRNTEIVGDSAFINNDLTEVTVESATTRFGAGVFSGNQANAASLLFYAPDPSIAKTYATTAGYTFLPYTAPPVEPETPVQGEFIEWTFSNASEDFVGVIPTISVLGGKPVEDIFIKNVEWVEEETSIPTSLGTITVEPDGLGNTLISIPDGLGTEATSELLEVEYEGVNFLDIKIQAKPQIKFNF